jgi:hypothetical protein
MSTCNGSNGHWQRCKCDPCAAPAHERTVGRQFGHPCAHDRLGRDPCPCPCTTKQRAELHHWWWRRAHLGLNQPGACMRDMATSSQLPLPVVTVGPVPPCRGAVPLTPSPLSAAVPLAGRRQRRRRGKLAGGGRRWQRQVLALGPTPRGIHLRMLCSLHPSGKAKRWSNSTGTMLPRSA